VATFVAVLAVLIFVYSVVAPLASLANTKVAYPRRKARAYARESQFRVGVFVPCQDANDHLEDNLRANLNLSSVLNARHYKTYRIYEKPIAGAQ
jgi:hypothetical protein